MKITTLMDITILSGIAVAVIAGLALLVGVDQDLAGQVVVGFGIPALILLFLRWLVG